MAAGGLAKPLAKRAAFVRGNTSDYPPRSRGLAPAQLGGRLFGAVEGVLGARF